MQRDIEKIDMVADELDYPEFYSKAELELLMKAEALLKSVGKIVTTDNAPSKGASMMALD